MYEDVNIPLSIEFPQFRRPKFVLLTLNYLNIFRDTYFLSKAEYSLLFNIKFLQYDLPTFINTYFSLLSLLILVCLYFVQQYWDVYQLDPMEVRVNRII